MNPSDPVVSEYVSSAGSLCGMHEFAKVHNYNLVLKPLRGTGGNGVYHTRSGKELEEAVLKLFAKDYALVISPYLEIQDEFRVIVLKGIVRLIYRKVRPCVVGDGVHSIHELCGKGGAEIPAIGEVHYTEWRHNLGHGAHAELIGTSTDLEILANNTATALNLQFCSVDIVKTVSGETMVLEVNSGVMMDSLIKEIGPTIPTEIYTDAILACMQTQL